MIDVRPYTPKDQAAVLELIDRSISTSRTAMTWEANPMTAVLAWDGDCLVGALPFEKRVMQLGMNSQASVLWVSASHVDEKYRSMGVGAKMDDFSRLYFAPDFDALFVYREDENSPAYNWYRKMGYSSILPILAFHKNVENTCSEVNTFIIETADEAGRYGEKLFNCFKSVVDDEGGYPARSEIYWQRLFSAHYYGSYYSYCIVALPEKQNGGIWAYALLGRTDMRDGIDRFDILEFIAPSSVTEDLLHSSIEKLASILGLQSIRMQLGSGEPLLCWAKDKGYVYRNCSPSDPMRPFIDVA